MENIPQFLSHLPIWKVNPLDRVKTAKRKPVRVREHKFDTVDKTTGNVVEKVCPICGKIYTVPYRLRNVIKTCGGSCGQKLRLSRMEPEKWVDEAVKLRQEGFKLSDIALRVNRATSTVWTYLKRRGY